MSYFNGAANVKAIVMTHSFIRRCKNTRSLDLLSGTSTGDSVAVGDFRLSPLIRRSWPRTSTKQDLKAMSSRLRKMWK